MSKPQNLTIPDYLKLDKNQVEKVYELYNLVKESWDPKDPFYSVSCLCRYLRARDWDITKAHAMLTESIKWRKVNKPDKISPECDAVKKIRKLKSSYTVGTSLKGEPVCYVIPSTYNPNPLEYKLQWMMYLLEEAIKRMPEGVETMVWIIDFSNFANRARSPNGKELITKTLSMLQNHYPERLGKLFIVDPPWWFNVVWLFVYPFLNSVTKNKIHLLSGDSKKELLKYIAPEQLDVQFGGKLELTDTLKENWDTLVVNKDGKVEKKEKMKNGNDMSQ